MSKKSEPIFENPTINQPIPIDDTLDLKDALLGVNKEEEFYKVLKEMYKAVGETDIRMKTTIPDALVNKLVRLLFWSEEIAVFDKYDRGYPKITKLVEDIIINNLYTLRVSVKGKGREDMFSTLKNKSNPEEKSRLQRIFGIGNR
jgi:hypothetical protein